MMTTPDTKSKPVVMLIETSPQAKMLMLKRRRLFVMGSNIPVRPLRCPDKSQAWVNVSIARPGSANPWDMAHDLANRVKAELGQSVFIEPDTGEQSRFAALHIPKRKKNSSSKAAMKALLGQKSKGASASNAAASLLGMSGGASNQGMFGANPMAGMAGMPGMGNMMPSIPDPLSDVLPQGVMEALSMQEEMRTPQGDDDIDDSKMVLETLESLPGWAELEQAKRHMFEAEARQLHSYIKTQPITPEDRTADITTALIRSPSISKPLKGFLVKASESKTAGSVLEVTA